VAIKATSYDVLIIYSSGNPYMTISDIKAQNVDAISTPTPRYINCEIIAEKLQAALYQEKIKVRKAESSEIKVRKEILKAKIIVIVTPAYFWNVSWKIKKLIDEQFSQIYILRNQKNNRRKLASFAMAEIKSSAQDALGVIKRLANDIKWNFGPKEYVLTKYSTYEVDKRIKKFSNKLIEQLKQ